MSALKFILYPLISGKNSKFAFFGKGLARELVPSRISRKALARVLASAKNYDIAELHDRVNYYCKLDAPEALPPDAETLGLKKIPRKKHAYFFDSREITRYFDPNLRWCFLPGDKTKVPSVPAILKSRPIAGDNRNAVLLKLNKVRHFIFVEDELSFAEKENIAVFRGKVHGNEKRRELFRKLFDKLGFDLGNTDTGGGNPPEWSAPKMTIAEQLRCKFIFAIEGNDVASNLKWVMSSNSVAVMPRPEFETWFMEGRLVPNVHYIEIAKDYSDVEEKLRFYSEHPEEAQKIIDAAHAWVDLFRDKKREKLLQILVMRKYLKLVNPRGNGKKKKSARKD